MMYETNDLRHVDVAILYGLGQKDRAHAIAKKLRPPELRTDTWSNVLTNDTSNTDTTLTVDSLGIGNN